MLPRLIYLIILIFILPAATVFGQETLYFQRLIENPLPLHFNDQNYYPDELLDPIQIENLSSAVSPFYKATIDENNNILTIESLTINQEGEEEYTQSRSFVNQSFEKIEYEYNEEGFLSKKSYFNREINYHELDEIRRSRDLERRSRPRIHRLEMLRDEWDDEHRELESKIWFYITYSFESEYLLALKLYKMSIYVPDYDLVEQQLFELTDEQNVMFFHRLDADDYPIESLQYEGEGYFLNQPQKRYVFLKESRRLSHYLIYEYTIDGTLVRKFHPDGVLMEQNFIEN